MTPQPRAQGSYVAAQETLDGILTQALDSAPWNQQAAIWLLAEHGHWAEQLIAKNAIAPGLHGDIAMRWSRVDGLLAEGDLTGTGSERAVLEVCLALVRPHPLPSLVGLDDTNIRRITYAIAWSACGQAYAGKLGLYAA